MDQSLAEGAGLEKLSPQQKEELMKTVQTQVALANMQELLTVIIKNLRIWASKNGIVCMKLYNYISLSKT